MTENELLALTAAVDARSEHPLAHAIVTAAQERTLQLSEPEDFKVEVGVGMSAIVNGRMAVIDNAAQMDHISGDITPLNQAAEVRRKDGAGVMLIAVDGKLVGFVPGADPIRPNARKSFEALRV